MVLNFKLTDSCIAHLINSDLLLGKVIEKTVNYSIKLNENYYLKLTKSIVGQQLYLKAQETLWGRVEDVCKEITPQNILSITDEQLKVAGISLAKISYIKGIVK